MKCKECNKENIYDANYCRYCKSEFSDEDRKLARSKTFVGKLEAFDKVKEHVTLSFILDNKYFRIVFLILMFLAGLFLYFSIGNELRIMKSTDYSVQYNKNTNEYYLVTDKDSVSARIFVPNSIHDLKVREYNESNEISDEKAIQSVDYNKDTPLKLEAKNDSAYYLFESEDKNDKLKIYVYKVEK